MHLPEDMNYLDYLSIIILTENHGRGKNELHFMYHIMQY